MDLINSLMTYFTYFWRGFTVSAPLEVNLPCFHIWSPQQQLIENLFTPIMSGKLLYCFDQSNSIFEGKQDFIAKGSQCCGLEKEP